MALWALESLLDARYAICLKLLRGKLQISTSWLKNGHTKRLRQTMSVNPYAPSKAVLDTEYADGTAWRKGRQAVIPVGRDMPCRCIKCNAPVSGVVKQRKVYWHHPGVYGLILINIILYAIVALIVRKAVKIRPALCELHATKRRNGILLCWGLLFAGFGSLVVSGMQSGNMAFVWLAVVLIIAAIVNSFLLRLIVARKIDDQYAYLAGCSEAYLASLPVFDSL